MMTRTELIVIAHTLCSRAYWVRVFEIAGEREWAKEVPHYIESVIETWSDSEAFRGARNAAARFAYETNAASHRRVAGMVKYDRVTAPPPPIAEACRKTVEAVAEVLEGPKAANVTRLRSKERK